MILIGVWRGGIVLRLPDAAHALLGRRHRPFFEAILHFSVAPDGITLEHPNADRPGDLLGDVRAYLDEVRLPYTLDDEATRIADRVAVSAMDLADAIAAGRETIAAALEQPEIPDFLRALLPHQFTPVRHLIAVQNAANFSVPGAGKTTMVLAAYQVLRRRGDVDLLVVVGPGSAFMPWEEEYAICIGGGSGRIIRLVGSPEERDIAYRAAERASLALVTYQTAMRDQERLSRLLRRKRVMLVLDESHYVKGKGAFAEAVLSIAAEAARRVILTGTPMPNGFSDLWTQLAFLWPEQQLFGNRLQFKTLVSSAAGEETVRTSLRPLFTRVRKRDLPLPEFQIVPIEVPLREQQQRIYDALAARTLQEIGLAPLQRMRLRQWRKAKIVRLIQAASNPALIAQESIEFSLPAEAAGDVPLPDLVENYMAFELSNKVLAVCEVVRRLADSGEKVVVWSHFVRNIELLLELLGEYGPLPLYGAVPRDEPDDEDFNRELHVRLFRTDPRHRVLIANPGAAAESISLHQICRNAVYMDRTFNAGQFIQSRDRIHRVGCPIELPVRCHVLISTGTIDEVIHRRLQDKEQLMLHALDDPDIPHVCLPISTGEVSGSEDDEVDFQAVLMHLQDRAARQGNRTH